MEEIDLPFKLGQRVRVKPVPGWQMDWVDDDELRIVGMRFGRDGKVDIALSNNWPEDGGADGFSPDDLIAA